MRGCSRVMRGCSQVMQCDVILAILIASYGVASGLSVCLFLDSYDGIVTVDSVFVLYWREYTPRLVTAHRPALPYLYSNYRIENKPLRCGEQN
jgi:hypothetical protein